MVALYYLLGLYAGIEAGEEVGGDPKYPGAVEVTSLRNKATAVSQRLQIDVESFRYRCKAIKRT